MDTLIAGVQQFYEENINESEAMQQYFQKTKNGRYNKDIKRLAKNLAKPINKFKSDKRLFPVNIDNSHQLTFIRNILVDLFEKNKKKGLGGRYKKKNKQITNKNCPETTNEPQKRQSQAEMQKIYVGETVNNSKNALTRNTKYTYIELNRS